MLTTKYHFSGAIIVFGCTVYNYPAGITHFCSMSGKLHAMRSVGGP